MPPIVPKERPQLQIVEARKLLQRGGVSLDKPALLGQRSYYRDTMGAKGKGDVGIYDDALFFCSPTAFVAFNANTDPSRLKPRVAVLKPGLYRYKIGIHGLSKPAARRYVALVQADKVTVLRHGAAPETGWFGINIHKGGYNTTSSLGCQTIYPDQWSAFINLVQGELARHDAKVIPYLLTERT
jgi:hypothetical protein